MTDNKRIKVLRYSDTEINRDLGIVDKIYSVNIDNKYDMGEACIHNRKELLEIIEELQLYVNDDWEREE